MLEALAASGLRSIRYALEIPHVESILANDISEEAYRSMQRNVEYNGVKNKVLPSQREASILMYEHRSPFTKRFDVIDLDPYGSPSQFLDSTVQSIRDGGKFEVLPFVVFVVIVIENVVAVMIVFVLALALFLLLCCKMTWFSVKELN